MQDLNNAKSSKIVEVLKERWDRMQKTAEELRIDAAKQVFAKYGFAYGYGIPDNVKGTKTEDDFWRDLNEAECEIYRKFEYFTDDTAELVGAQKAFDYIILQLKVLES